MCSEHFELFVILPLTSQESGWLPPFLPSFSEVVAEPQSTGWNPPAPCPLPATQQTRKRWQSSATQAGPPGSPSQGPAATSCFFTAASGNALLLPAGITAPPKVAQLSLGGKGWLLDHSSSSGAEGVHVWETPRRCLIAGRSFPTGLTGCFPAGSLSCNGTSSLLHTASLQRWLAPKSVFTYSDQAIKLYNYTLVFCKLCTSREKLKCNEWQLKYTVCIILTPMVGRNLLGGGALKCMLTEYFSISSTDFLFGNNLVLCNKMAWVQRWLQRHLNSSVLLEAGPTLSKLSLLILETKSPSEFFKMSWTDCPRDLHLQLV